MIRALAVAAVLVLPGPAMIALAMRGGDFLNEWYLLYTLPSLVALLAIGFAWAGSFLPEGRGATALTAAAMLGWLAAFGAVSQPARRALLSTSLEPVRESVLLTRPTLDPFDPANDAILTASFSRLPDYYDPRVVQVRTTKELGALMLRTIIST